MDPEKFQSLFTLAPGKSKKPVTDKGVYQELAYTSAMKRIIWSVLAVFLVSANAATVKVRITLPGTQYKSGDKILARVENIGTQPVTICLEIGQSSFNKGEIEATPIPFWVEQNASGKWGTLLIGPDIGSNGQALVLGAGKSNEFPFRLSAKGAMRLRLNYWPGSQPNLNCSAQTKGGKQLASPTFAID